LTSWTKTGGGQLSSPLTLTFSNVRKQILWGNRFITFEKKYLLTFYIYHFQPTLLKISYQCISFYLIWFPIPYKFKTLTLYLFFVLFPNDIPEFCKNVLTSWIKTGGGQLSSPLTFSNVRKQILWGNRFITFEKKYLFLRTHDAFKNKK
jgi:hypothetical protein